MEEKLQEWYKDHFLLSQLHFTWGMVEDPKNKELLIQYLTPTVKYLDVNMKKRCFLATNRIAQLFQRTYKYLMSNKHLLNHIGLHPELLKVDLEKQEDEFFSQITRFDFLVNDDWTKIKLCEANTATPQGLVEADLVNTYMCKKNSDRCSPNTLSKNLFRMWKDFRDKNQISDTEIIHYTTYEWHDEDYYTAKFITENAHPNGKTKFIPIEKLIVTETGIFDTDNLPVKYLYILYPLEYLPFDQSISNNEKIGNKFLKHVSLGNIKIINPFSATIMQTKKVMPLIWKLAEDTNLFSKEELSWINEYFVPTFNWNKTKSQLEELLYLHGPKLVLKPIYGREGEGIFIITPNNIEDIWEQINHNDDWYIKQEYIIQKYSDTFKMSVETWEGNVEKKVVVGSFYINNNPCGFYLRADNEVTGSNCLLVNTSIY